ncbi:MAG: amidohydrolase family protein [Proteobacteria bacterium]|nr:amidohydrolase family protein [Pseudomonadota bacterium]
MTQPHAETTRVRNADWVVAWDGAASRHVYLRDADVVFAGDAIVQVGGRYDGAVARDIDGRGLMVLPGFVDIHAHPSSEPMIKGLTDEVGSRKLYMSSLYEYLFLFRPDAEGAQAATEVALCELMMSGVTTLCDLSMAHEGWLETLGASGIRAIVAPMFRSGRWHTPNGHDVRYDWNEKAGREGLVEALRLIDRAQQHPSGRLSGMVCPAQIDTCTAELIGDAVAVAKERRLPFQIHAAQSVVEFQEIMRRHGRTPIEWLHDLGALGPNAIIGHGIFLDHHSWLHWPTRGDIGLLAETGTTVAHCPTVFSRRGITLQDFGAYRAAGINLGIGTDTFPHNFVEEMRTAAILARVTTGNAHSVRTTDIFDAATTGGAKALGRDDIGRLMPGAKADLVLVDIAHPAMRPVHDPVRSFIYSAGERAVRDVYVDGRPVVRDGKPLAFDHAEACARLEAAQRRAVPRASDADWGRRPLDEIIPPTFPIARH